MITDSAFKPFLLVFSAYSGVGLQPQFVNSSHFKHVSISRPVASLEAHSLFMPQTAYNDSSRLSHRNSLMEFILSPIPILFIWLPLKSCRTNFMTVFFPCISLVYLFSGPTQDEAGLGICPIIRPLYSLYCRRAWQVGHLLTFVFTALIALPPPFFVMPIHGSPSNIACQPAAEL